MRHASTHNILYHLQHGFRDKRSCETQLLEFQNDIVTNMNNGKQTGVIVMDFAKAFDKVGHRRLIEKMKYYGVRGKTNKWIKDLIAGRNQRVVLDGEKCHTTLTYSQVYPKAACTHNNKEEGTYTLRLCASWPQARTRTDCKILGCHYLTRHALEHTRGQHSEEKKPGFGL